jgi:hypothetical protein
LLNSFNKEMNTHREPLQAATKPTLAFGLVSRRFCIFRS